MTKRYSTYFRYMNSMWSKLFDLRASADYNGTIHSISEGVSLKGYNLWLLLCAAMLASIGLDTNSAAIIIGAMLISPLMSPILGVGLSIAIHDRTLLLRSTRNLIVAVIISLFASAVYFVLTPLGTPTEQLQARTYPTLLDVLVALFGGLAGIVSISRKGPSNAIPGVAIATALMPPLCTAGYGIATANWLYFAGAFYLFFINAVFISIATYLVVKYLNFPIVSAENKLKKLYSVAFILIAILALLPSIYFLYGLYKKEVVRQKVVDIAISPLEHFGNEVLKWEIEPKDSLQLIKIYHSGKPIGDSLRHRIDSSLALSGLVNFTIQPMRVNLTKEEVTHMSAEVVRQMFDELHIRELMALQSNNDTLPYVDLWRELKPLFPQADSVSGSWHIASSLKRKDTIFSLTYFSSKKLSIAYEARLAAFAKNRMNADSVLINYREQQLRIKR